MPANNMKLSIENATKRIVEEDCYIDHVENLNIQEKDLTKVTDSSLSVERSLVQEEKLSQNSTEEQEGKTSPVAWFEAIVCVFVNCSCAMMWMTAPSTPSVMSQWMDVSLTQLNWLSNSSAICNTLFSLFSAWAYDKFGIKMSLIMCSVINAAGCWIRCIAIILPVEKRYAIIMLGQTVASIGGPLVYNLAAKFVAVWFASQDRGIANTILSIQLGMALAPLVLPNIAPTVEDVPNMLYIVAGISTVCTIPTFLIPKSPKVPPSVSSALDRTPFWQGVKAVAKNVQFWVVAFIASVSIGMVFSVSVLVIEAISPYGYTEQQAGICASIIVFSGFLGGGMTGYWAGKTAQHIMLIKLFTPITVFTYVIFIFDLLPNSFATVIIACILNGFFSYALFPIYLELASELTYPVSESISSCIIWTLCTVTLLIFTIIIDALRAGPDANPPSNMNTSMIVVAVIMAAGNIPCLWLKGDLKRLQIDSESKRTIEQRA